MIGRERTGRMFAKNDRCGARFSYCFRWGANGIGRMTNESTIFLLKVDLEFSVLLPMCKARRNNHPTPSFSNPSFQRPSY